MTPRWRRAIRHRNRLRKKYNLDPNTINWNTDKRQRNYCTSDHWEEEPSSITITTKLRVFLPLLLTMFLLNPGLLEGDLERYFTPKRVQANRLYYWRTTSILLIRNVWQTSSMNFNIGNEVPRPEQSQYGVHFTYHPTIHGINDFHVQTSQLWVYFRTY